MTCAILYFYTWKYSSISSNNKFSNNKFVFSNTFSEHFLLDVTKINQNLFLAPFVFDLMKEYVENFPICNLECLNSIRTSSMECRSDSTDERCWRMVEVNGKSSQIERDFCEKYSDVSKLDQWVEINMVHWNICLICN